MTRPPHHILFVCSSLGAGGAERVMSQLANAWVEAGDRVTLVTLSSADTDFYKLDMRVERFGLKLLSPSRSRLQALTANYGRLRALRAVIREQRPDVVISFMDKTNVLVLLATRGLGIPIIVSERIDPRYHSIAAGWDIARRMLYPRAAAVVVQTRAVATWARAIVPVERVAVIPNPVAPIAPVPTPAGEKRVVAMGRLDWQKGFDLLIRAFADIAERLPDWTLHVYGEGPERGALEALIRDEGLDGRIVLKGRSAQPHMELSRAGVFVLSSRYEGMPNVLLEAMSLGTACISFDCPSGPAEIISSGETGILVPSESIIELAAAIERLISDEVLRRRLAAAAPGATARFALPAVIDQWDKLLESMLR